MASDSLYKHQILRPQLLGKLTSSEKIEKFKGNISDLRDENYKWNDALVVLLNLEFLIHRKSKSMAVRAKKQHGRRWFSSVQLVFPCVCNNYCFTLWLVVADDNKACSSLVITSKGFGFGVSVSLEGWIFYQLGSF
ncbi:hypothetical protein YC2023_080745 [Brassica napus]